MSGEFHRVSDVLLIVWLLMRTRDQGMVLGNVGLLLGVVKLVERDVLCLSWRCS